MPHRRWLVVYAGALAVKWAVFTLGWHRPLALGVTAWDARHYLTIAAHGYPAAVGAYSHLAYFPGMPLVIRAVRPFAGSYVAAGFAASCLLGALACWFAAQLVADRYGPQAGVRAAIALAVAPGAFLFGLAYAEPLAVALGAGTLLYLGRRDWPRAGLCALAAGLSSPFAMPLALAAGWVAFRRRSPGAAAVAAAPPIGFAAFQLYGLAHTGRMWSWFAAEHTFGQGLDLANTLHRFTQSSGVGIPLTVAVSGLAAAAGCWALWRIRAPGTWWLVTAPVLAVGLFAGGSWLNPRLLLDAFPLELAAGIALRAKPARLVAAASFVTTIVALGAYVIFWPNAMAQP